MGRQQKSFGPHPREKKQVNISKTKRLKHYYINRKLKQKYFIRDMFHVKQ